MRQTAQERELVDKFERARWSADLLGFPGHITSRKPIKTAGYANCVGIALIGPRDGGLSHYNLDSGTPEVYFRQLVDEMAYKPERMRAALIGGDTNHADRCRRLLREYEIPIVTEYIDGWMEDEDSVIQDPGVKKSHKHVIVISHTREVLMFSKPVGYMKLI